MCVYDRKGERERALLEGNSCLSVCQARDLKDYKGVKEEEEEAAITLQFCDTLNWKHTHRHDADTRMKVVSRVVTSFNSAQSY